MESVCKYCSEFESKQDDPALKCLICQNTVHLKCLVREGTPGNFAGDVFFDYTCCDCTGNNLESFTRNKMPWVNAILLTIHHLNIQLHGISHHGFFHYKTHIASFIDRHWHLLFGTQVKQKKNWMGTIAGTLSVYNGLLFRSGSVILGEPGWWKLRHNFSPALAAHIITEMAKDRPKGRPRGQLGMDRNLFYAKVKALGFTNYMVTEKETPMSYEPTPKKARRVSETEPEPRSSGYDHDGRSVSDVEPRSESESMTLDESYACLAGNSYGDMENFFSSYEFGYHGAATTEHNDSSSERTHTTLTEAGAAGEGAGDSDSPRSPRSPLSPPAPPDRSDDEPRRHTARRKTTETVVRRESLFSSLPNSVDTPWLHKDAQEQTSPSELVELTEYEEVQLLKQVEGLLGRVREPDKKAYLHRLRAKLALRRLKRHRHLPIFDLDKTVKVLGGYVADAPKVVANVERVLDRFQRSYLADRLSGTIAGRGPVLVAAGGGAALRSPAGAVLKPYIRRDRAARPLWPRLLDELLQRTHRDDPEYVPRALAPLDYSYVRPHHIPAVNSLCAQFFWPGIDLTEALQQPEHSCVVTWGRLLVACAFLVRDARPGEAYLSFVLTRPEWRRAGIATFMLYHLLQTCTGKDVTLHVSPTNPAIFLYQKFGFKVEEFVQDFYEKYYDIDHKGCRHALFLRLVR